MIALDRRDCLIFEQLHAPSPNCVAGQRREGLAPPDLRPGRRPARRPPIPPPVLLSGRRGFAGAGKAGAPQVTRGRGGGVFRAGALLFGFAFLYAPIALLVLYSFNASRLVTVWAGFSTRWYGELARNDGFRQAAATSLEVAAMAASLALVLGTMAGLAMARFSRFPGRALFGFALLAPLVVPEVILGLSLLLLFVACESWLGWPGRGVLTITIAHATFAACFVSVLVRAQLAGFDRTLEEAACDLGARAWTVLARITLPGIAPALISGWLLAFTLSLDDLVVASFVTGPSATTLPMAVFSSVRLGVSPQVNALATLFLGVVFVLVALAFWLMARAQRVRAGGRKGAA